MCMKCRQELPEASFTVNRRYADGLERKCRACLSEERKAAYDRTPDLYRALSGRSRRPDGLTPRQRRARHLRETYGITLEDEARILAKQNGQCPICGSPAEVVDHCHTTRRVRGLLCQKCNRGLGHFQDNPVMLAKAIEYLTGSMQDYLTLTAEEPS